MPKQRKRTRPNKSKKTHAFSSAPGMGVDREEWVQNEIVPLQANLPAGVACVVIVAADVNGYTTTVSNTQSGIVIFAETKLWGEDNGQFQPLANLYEMYRTNKLEIQVFPVQGGAIFSSGPIIHGIDPVGAFDTTSVQTPAALNKLLESLKNVQLSNSYLGVTQRVDFNQWIGQNQAEAWLKTQATDTTQIIREQYLTNQAVASERKFTTPGFVAAWTITSPAALQRAQLAIFKIRTHLTFRQRRLRTGEPFLEEMNTQVMKCILDNSQKELVPQPFPGTQSSHNTVLDHRPVTESPYPSLHEPQMV